MATMLKTPNGMKRFNSYYLAVVEKNKLLKKGVKAEIVDEPEKSMRPFSKDCKLRTVYTPQDRKALKKLRQEYEPNMTKEFGQC